VPNGKRAYRRALFKFGFGDISFSHGAVATNLQPANTSVDATNEDGSTTASPSDNDAEFVSPVTVGGQTLVMDFDSGSSDLYDYLCSRTHAWG
jgi:hypothetical protein